VGIVGLWAWVRVRGVVRDSSAIRVSVRALWEQLVAIAALLRATFAIG
jgi:hypothetical protein